MFSKSSNNKYKEGKTDQIKIFFLKWLNEKASLLTNQQTPAKKENIHAYETTTINGQMEPEIMH